jgi:predicted Zn finger-like uncharacterized protein
MKVVCESCHTRYAIADDKVRGKSFKIKCKKCGAFMYVRPPEGDADATAEKPSEPGEVLAAGLIVEPPARPGGAPGGSPRPAAGQVDEEEEKETRVFNYAEFERLMADKAEDGTPAAVVSPSARAPAGAPEWYLLYGEEQQGPLTAGDVEQRIRRGEVDRETYVWRDGLADWRPLREVEALATLLAPVAQVPEESPAPAALSVSAGRGAAVPDLLDAAYGGSNAGFVASPAPEPAPTEKKMTAQRHEDSVLFSLKSLGVITFQDGAEAPRVVETPKGGREARLGAVPAKEMRLGMPVGVAEGGGRAVADLPLPPPIVVLPARRGLSSGAKIGIAVGSVAVVAAAAVGIVFILKETPAPQVPRGVSVAPTAPSAGPPSAPTAPGATPGPAMPGTAPGSAASQKAGAPAGALAPDGGAAAVAAAAPAEPEEEEESPRKGRGRRAAKKKPTQVAMAQPAPTETQPGVTVSREPIREREEAPAAPPPPPPPQPSKAVDSEVKAILDERAAKPPPRTESQAGSPSDDPSLPETLEKSTVHRVIRRNMSGIIRCYNTKVTDKGTKKGTLNVSFSIQKTGKTSGIRVEKPQFWGGDFVGCVGDSVSKWKFPRFKGEEIEITYPFILGGF